MSEELLEGIKKFTQRADNALNSILEKEKIYRNRRGIF